MEVLREVIRITSASGGRVVSILVLMEVLREAMYRSNRYMRDGVSILVLMEVLREVQDYTLLHHDLTLFQSLF